MNRKSELAKDCFYFGSLLETKRSERAPLINLTLVSYYLILVSLTSVSYDMQVTAWPT